MRVRQILPGLSAFLFFLPRLAAQKVPEKLDFLQKNIRVWVIHQPNADTPSIYKVQPTGVFLDTDGIIMGKKSNNGMTGSAKLLSALFKDSDKASNKGHGMLQDLVYSMLKEMGKPVDLYFINDAKTKLTDRYRDLLGIYGMPIAENHNLVYPAVYAPGNGNDSSAGKIVFGEYGNVRSEMSSLLRAMSFLYLHHYSYLKPVSVFSYENNNPPPAMYQDKVLKTVRLYADAREGLYNAVSLALLMESGISTGLEKSYYNEWLATAPYCEIRLSNNFIFLKANSRENIPAQFMLNGIVMNNLISGKDTGYILTSPPFENDKDILNSWKIYDFRTFNTKAKAQQEIVTALLLKKYIDHNFSDAFFGALIYDNRRLEKKSLSEWFPVLIENLCLYGMDTNVPVGDKTYGIHFYPLALIDLILGFPPEIMDNNRYSFRTFFGVFGDQPFSEPLREAYFKLRPAIKEAVKKANKKPDVQPLYSGHDNFSAMSESIWEFLKNKR